MAAIAQKVHARAPALPKPSGNKYSISQLEQLWVDAGGPAKAAPLAAAIAVAESAGNPFATNHNTNGSVDRGLWQINSVHSQYNPAKLMGEPLYNAKAAVEIFKGKGETFTDWATFNNGNAAKVLAGLPAGAFKGESAFKIAEEDAKVKGTGITEGPPSISLTGKFGELGLMLIMLLAGAMLLIYGIAVAVRPKDSALSLPKIPVPVPV